ncbi:MAG: GIY-YIG nuclease family protein [Patescibacteria group bacterium]|nr:GIY-YIG nuclease family protein [Patescibacteria group bacterium]
MYYVYLLKSKKDNSIYIGYTNNLKSRFKQHNNAESKFTKNKIPWGLIYSEIYKDKSDAKYREKNLKRFAQAHNQLKKRIKNSLA